MKTLSVFLADFSARAAKVKVQHPLDPLSYPVYAMIALTLSAETIVLLATNFSIDLTKFLPPFFGVLWMAICALLARAYGLPRIALIFEASSLPVIIGVLTGFGSIMLSRLALADPVDAMLVAADRRLGLDWIAWLEFYRRNPWAMTFSNFAYMSMFLQLTIVPMVLFLFGHRARGWTVISAWTLAGAISWAVFPFFPTHGPYVYFGISQGYLPNLEIDWPWYYGEVIYKVRAGVPIDVGQALGGLIQFPSFHVAAAVIFAWATWPLPGLRWVCLVLNIAMILSTPIRGAHYFVDTPGGVAVAILAIIGARIMMRLSQTKCDIAGQVSERRGSPKGSGGLLLFPQQ